MLLVLCACAETVSIDRGVTSDSSYTNESLSVNFTKPAGWRFYTEEELAKLLNVTVEQFRDESFSDAAKLNSVFEFMAVNESTGDNVSLIMENLRPSGNTGITEERYAELSRKNMQEQLVGATYTFGEDSRVSVGGQSYLRITAKCSYSGITMQQYMYLRKVGSYMVVITATSMSGKDASEFEKMFS